MTASTGLLLEYLPIVIFLGIASVMAIAAIAGSYVLAPATTR